MTVFPTGLRRVRAMQMWKSSGAAPICARTPAEIGIYFEGLEILDPGLGTVSHWRFPDSGVELKIQVYA